MKRVVVSCAVALVMCVLAGAVGAATSLTVAPSPVHRGHRVIVRGNADGCPIGAAVTIISRAFAHTHDFAGVPDVFARVRRRGKFETRPRMPSSQPSGRYAAADRRRDGK